MIPTLLSPPQAPEASANVVVAEPAIVDTAQKVGTGTEAEGMAEAVEQEELDALPDSLSEGSAVVGPADGDGCALLLLDTLLVSETDEDELPSSEALLANEGVTSAVLLADATGVPLFAPEDVSRMLCELTGDGDGDKSGVRVGIDGATLLLAVSVASAVGEKKGVADGSCVPASDRSPVGDKG